MALQIGCMQSGAGSGLSSEGMQAESKPWGWVEVARRVARPSAPGVFASCAEGFLHANLHATASKVVFDLI